MNPTLPVSNVVCYEKIENPILAFDLEKSINNQRKLIEYIDEIKIIATKAKWSTWGRTYFEFPIHVLEVFGIQSNNPLTVYFNYVYNKKFIFIYAGSIFSGDAAWFDEYVELSSSYILEKESFKWIHLENIFENHEQKNFIKYFDSNFEKWEIVPVQNLDAAAIATKKNNHLKP